MFKPLQHPLKLLCSRIFPISSDSIISVDRAYIDYKWLYSLKKSRVFFVTRAKRNLKYEVIGQHGHKIPDKILLFPHETVMAETIFERISLIDLLS